MSTHASRRERLRAQPGIILTPLIDILFNLIFFFILATTIRDRERIMDIELPESRRAAATRPDPDWKVLEVDDAGRVYMEGQELPATQIRSELDGLARQGILRVIVRADRRADWGRIYGLLEDCQEEGVQVTVESSGDSNPATQVKETGGE